MFGHSPSTTTAAQQAQDHRSVIQKTGYKQRTLPSKTQPRAEQAWAEGFPESSDKRSQEKRQQRGSECTGGISQAKTLSNSPNQSRSPQQQINQQSSTIADDSTAKSARQTHKQVVADAVVAQHIPDDAHGPAGSPTAQGIARLPNNGNIGVECEKTASNGGAATNRKAEYARQLREQIAADKAARRATDSERKRTGAPDAAILFPSGRKDICRDSERNGGVMRSKAEYARQLRKQMATNEAARCAEGRKEDSPMANVGPAWLEGATEGRERHRRNLNAEYAVQLRAQIAAQRNSAQQDRLALQTGPFGDDHHSGYGTERLQQQWSRAPGKAENESTGHEWQLSHKSRGGHTLGGENYRDGILDKDSAVAPSRRAGHDPLALER